MSATIDPLTGPLPDEIPLPNAPLVRVLAQVRFPEIAAVGTPEFIAPFQEAVRPEYGILERTMAQRFEFGPAGAVAHPAATNSWRFYDTTRKWRLTLAANFLSLETTSYTSRGDFLDRLRRALVALKVHVNPAIVQRLGVRYIDRVPVASREEVLTLVREEAAGLLASEVGRHAAYAVVDNLFELANGAHLHARWGALPPKFTMDPVTVEPIDDACWVLDLDSFVEKEQALDVDVLSSQSKELAESCYRFFRWVVTPAFLKRFGGAV